MSLTNTELLIVETECKLVELEVEITRIEREAENLQDTVKDYLMLRDFYKGKLKNLRTIRFGSSNE